MSIIWENKIFILVIIFCLFIFSLIKISNSNIFFETERVINEFSQGSDISNLIDDKNIICLGFDFKDVISYEDILNVKKIHEEIKKNTKIKRVQSIINESVIINMGGLFPIPEKILKIDTENDYRNSIARINKNGSNFINSETNKLFFLIQPESEININDSEKLIEDLQEIKKSEIDAEIFLSGRIPSEVYFKDKVISEFVVLTLLSAFLCCLLLYFLTTNIILIFSVVSSVIFSIIISLGLSVVLYDGIEMIMIISPAILFIVCISDIMHFTTNQDKFIKNKYLFFEDRINKIGKAIMLTSFTTSISFLTFLINDIVPIARFGIITSFGILFTLLVVTVVYAISIDYNFNNIKQYKYFKNFTDFIISFSLSKKSSLFHFIMLCFFILGVFSFSNIKVDNYLTDEVNEKSKLSVEWKFFDNFFGGVKPISFEVNNITNNNLIINDFNNDLINYNFNIDASNLDIPNEFLQYQMPVFGNLDSSYLFLCRMPDVGSRETKKIIDSIKNKYYSSLDINVTGVGYLFDEISDRLTKQLVYGLLLAICSIGLIFYFITNFNFRYMIISIVPNIVPIILTLGVLQFFDFYFSLSNAFIFTIVFGLIVDDSIHIISSYIRRKKYEFKSIDNLNNVIKTTGRAVVKTTFVVVVCLLPLLFSEFKSVSQLSVITIMTALTAVVFDLIYLPVLIRSVENC